MKYRLYDNAENNVNDVVNNILKNRGIENPKRYFEISEKDVIPYSNLDNINLAVELFDKHFVGKNKIGILIDEDVDGFTSASVMYNYIRDLDKSYPLKYITHTKAKSHGLSEDVVIPQDIKLLIIPDAGSNDIEQCKFLKEKNVDIIILDHHECEEKNDYAIVVNNQISKKYTNKDLSGVGVVYKFCQALDDFYWCNYADNYIDLVALGLIGDVMDMRSYETKYLTDLGLGNISNNFFKALIESQSFSMNDIVTIHNVQWYIVPIINALIRVGSLDEKELIFRAFINDNEEFEYKKRSGEIIIENIYDRSARFCKNAKSRQTRMVDKSFKILSKNIIDKKKNDKILIVNGTENTNNALTGLVCMKIADYFDKPCILLHQRQGSENLYGGSARNIKNSMCNSLKDTLQGTNCFNFCVGHQNAFGVEINNQNISKVKNILNDVFKNIPNEKVYIVDFDLNEDQINIPFIKELDSLSEYYSQGIEEPKVASEVTIYKSKVELLGKEKNTISFINDNGIKYLLFKCDEEDELLFNINSPNDFNTYTLSIVGKPCINLYNGLAIPQFIIEDYDIIKKEFIEFCEENNLEEDIWD